MPTRRLVVLAVAGALPLLAALAALFVLRDSGASTSAYRGSRPPEGYIAPTFRLRSYTGREVRMDELRDKTVVLTFLDAQCQESCPVIAAAAPRARARLDPEDRARVALIAITTDPAEDTPAVVRSFLRRYRAEGALDYLVGPELELRRVWRDYGVLPSESSGSDDLHSAPVRIYAPGGEWVSTLSAAVELTPRNLAHDIQVAIATN